MDKKTKLSVLAVLMLSASVTCAVATDSDSDADGGAPQRKVVTNTLAPAKIPPSKVAEGVVPARKAQLTQGNDSSDDEDDASSNEPVKESKQKVFARVLSELEKGTSPSILKRSAVEGDMHRITLAEYYLSGGLLEPKSYIEKLLKRHEEASSVESADARKMPASRDVPQRKEAFSVAAARTAAPLRDRKEVDVTVEQSIDRVTDLAVLGTQVEQIMSLLGTRSPDAAQDQLAAYSSALTQLQALNNGLPPHFAKALDAKIKDVESKVEELSAYVNQANAAPVLQRFVRRYTKGVATRRLLVEQYKGKLEDLQAKVMPVKK